MTPIQNDNPYLPARPVDGHSFRAASPDLSPEAELQEEYRRQLLTDMERMWWTGLIPSVALALIVRGLAIRAGFNVNEVPAYLCLLAASVGICAVLVAVQKPSLTRNRQLGQALEERFGVAARLSAIRWWDLFPRSMLLIILHELASLFGFVAYAAFPLDFIVVGVGIGIASGIEGLAFWICA